MTSPVGLAAVLGVAAFIGALAGAAAVHIASQRPTRPVTPLFARAQPTPVVERGWRHPSGEASPYPIVPGWSRRAGRQ